MTERTRGIHWFRNDLRLEDNTALADLTQRVEQWLPVFIFDPDLSTGEGEPLPKEIFLLECLASLERQLGDRGIPLLVRSGDPEVVLPTLCREVGARWVSLNQDTTPFASQRDKRVTAVLEREGVEVLAARDRVVFGPDEVVTGAGKPYSVYSAYRKRWWRHWQDEPRLPSSTSGLPAPIPGVANDPPEARPWADQSGNSAPGHGGGISQAMTLLDSFLDKGVLNYRHHRDIPSREGTSRLSPFLRFGAVSPRQCFGRAFEAQADNPQRADGVGKWLDELIWRDFYAGILEKNPRARRGNLKPEYDSMEWSENEDFFQAWCQGRTGFPIVDAGMRQLLETGWMHNRLRMVVASFLTKDLLIDWRKGERFFFDRLVDADPASNSGGWQWAASTGTDAQPYFRVLNPTAQGRRWDPEGEYIRRWVGELRGLAAPEIHEPSVGHPGAEYPRPVVDHAERRLIALDRFKRAASSRKSDGIR
ncbi:MAG: deoxyribodipyrimidine photo-lyase [Myxococcota bacterium]|nr:deoxyribodipyrimidine photo-lyase [Myxococcota bacterium]